MCYCILCFTSYPSPLNIPVLHCACSCGTDRLQDNFCLVLPVQNRIWSPQLCSGVILCVWRERIFFLACLGINSRRRLLSAQSRCLSDCFCQGIVCLHQPEQEWESVSPSTPTKTSEAGSASLLKAAAVSPVVFKCLKIQSGQNRSRFDTYLRTMKIGWGAR